MKKELAIDLDDALEIMLENGFMENQWGSNRTVRRDEEYPELVEAIKTYDDEKIAVALTIWEKDITLRVYRYKGDPRGHTRVSGVRNHKKYTNIIKEIWEGW